MTTRLGLVDVLERQQARARSRETIAAAMHRHACQQIAAASLPRTRPAPAQAAPDKHEGPSAATERPSTTSTRSGGFSGCSNQSA